MSVESFSCAKNNILTPRERWKERGVKAAGGLAIVGAIAGTTYGPVAPAEAKPAGVSEMRTQWGYEDTEVILVGGTSDPDSMILPAYEHFLPPGADGSHPNRVRYPATAFPYDMSVNAGADWVYTAITQAPEDRDFVVIAHSQGGHAAWNGIARAVNDQPHRRDNIELHSFGDPGHPWRGIFKVLPPLPGFTPPPPRPDIGVDTTYYCLENVPNDSICNYQNDPVKAAIDWWHIHPQDKPDRFAFGDPNKMVTIPLSPSVQEVLLHD